MMLSSSQCFFLFQIKIISILSFCREQLREVVSIIDIRRRLIILMGSRFIIESPIAHISHSNSKYVPVGNLT